MGEHLAGGYAGLPQMLHSPWISPFEMWPVPLQVKAANLFYTNGHWKGGEPCLDFIDELKERVTQLSERDIQAWRAMEEELQKSIEG